MPEVMLERGTMLVRYRFDTLEQLAQHLHVMPAATLLFLPEPRIANARVRTVLVELSVRETRQQTVVRGEPVAQALDAPPGAWLELSEHHLPRLARPPGPFMARRDQRVSGNQLLKLRGQFGEQVIAQLLDLGAGGLRVRAPRELMTGDIYLVRLLDVPPSRADLGPAQVVRVRGGEAGLRFVAPGTIQVMRYIGSLRESWLRAQDLRHHPRCCVEGGPPAPSLPQLRTKSVLGSAR
jgi:PilZ domain